MCQKVGHHKDQKIKNKKDQATAEILFNGLSFYNQ